MEQSSIKSTDIQFSKSSNLWIKIGILVSVIALTYSDAIFQLIKIWTVRDDYSFGPIIPLISLYFVWFEREKLKNLPVIPHIPGGLIITIISGAILLLGKIGGISIIQDLSIIILIIGLVLLLLGMRFLIALTFPIAYLIFMVPVLDPIINNIRWPFQIVTAISSGTLLKLIGIPIFQHMQYIELPSISLEVADVCSGVNFFVSIIAISLPLAYFTQQRWSMRAILLGFAMVIGVLTNILRVTLIGIWAYYVGGKDIHGPLHIFQGIFVAITGFIALIIFSLWLSKYNRQSIKEEKKQNHDSMISPIHIDLKKFNNGLNMLIIIMILLGGSYYLYKPEPKRLMQEVSGFPLMVGNWQGQDFLLSKNNWRAYQADEEVSHIYRDLSGREIIFYIGYFETQNQEKEIIGYRWSKLYKDAEEINIQTNSGEVIPINKTIIKEGNDSYLVLYLYDLDNRFIANAYQAKLLTMFNGIAHRHTNGAIIIITSKLNLTDNSDSILKSEKDFVEDLFPLLRQYIR